MPKPDSYNGIRKIETAGLTLPNGKFIGFLNGMNFTPGNGTTGQEITISGDLIYNGLTRSVEGITFFVPPGAYVPVECTRLKPASYPIIGYF